METPFPPFRTRALAHLQEAFGPDAEFREGQLEAIEAVLHPGSRLLVVQRTGWGKSIVYFLSAREIRDRDGGMTLVISPLLSLMRNQIEMARKLGIRAATINSTNEEEWDAIEESFAAGSMDVLFVSPERLANPGFCARLEAALPRIGLLVIDEAHCISDWGHDFRPDYRRILPWAARLTERASVLATTATATARVIEDVAAQLGGGVEVQRGSVVRQSLQLSSFEMPLHSQRLAWLAKFLPRFPGTGIVYTLTIHDAELVAEFLRSKGIRAESYHADLDHERRLELEERFQANELKALVATSALGMGYDKGDVGFVCHYQLPPSMLAYYQQIGRAGRTIPRAYACLLFGEADLEIAAHFQNTAIPPLPVFERILDRVREGPADASALAKASGAALPVLLQALKILQVEGIIERSRDQYALASEPPELRYERYRALQALRAEESAAMLAYARGEGCRMQAIGALLGEEGIAPCGVCDRCRKTAHSLPDEPSVHEAEEFLRSVHFWIEPKAMAPSAEPGRVRQSIPKEERLEPGLALSAYNDSGYGGLVRRSKYGPEPYPEVLVAAAADAVSAHLPPCEWVAWVPSMADGKVGDFARRLAAQLGIPAVEAVRKVAANEPQKAMLFAQAQYENVRGNFAADQAMPGACLLVDDIVDSGWTLTVVGGALRRAGASHVIPFALATARPRRKR